MQLMIATFQVPASGLPQCLMDAGQLVFWFLSLPIACVAAWKAIVEIRESRLLRERELRERKASLARDLIARIEEDRFIQGMFQVVDYDGGSELTLQSGKSVRIDQDFLIRSIRTQNIELDEDEFALRELYVDRLLVFFETLEHHIDADLIEFEDVDYRLSYLVGRLKRQRKLFEAFSAYMAKFDYTGAAQFLERFKSHLP